MSESNRKKVILISIACGAAGLIIGGAVCFGIFSRINKIVKEVHVETGSAIDASAFFSGDSSCGKILTDLSKIDTSVPGEYRIMLSVLNKKYTSLLEISDTTPPSGTAVPQTIMAGALPDAADTVTDLYDLSGTVYTEYLGTPDTGLSGDVTIPVALTDAYGNIAVINVPFTVIEDTTPPVISGARDITIVAGEPLVLLSHITVNDDYTREPTIDVDMSDVDTNTPGTYQAEYIATDEYGNESRVPITITVQTRPDNYIDPEDVYAMARTVYNEIIDRDDYSDIEIAMRIFKWVFDHVMYIPHADTSHWTGAAHIGFTAQRGDCYTCYACSKALLDIAGIDNLCVYGEGSEGYHYWNLVKLDGQWYNCDATPTHPQSGYYFMRTDAEMYRQYPIRSTDLPPRATQSVQRRLDFTNLTIH
ncbi:MAG: hypothetical protein J6Z43_11215 [Clostridiales bacterium]|nr:hypothetical protein [Clostridiales bacterium]